MLPHMHLYKTVCAIIFRWRQRMKFKTLGVGALVLAGLLAAALPSQAQQHRKLTV